MRCIKKDIWTAAASAIFWRQGEFELQILHIGKKGNVERYSAGLTLPAHTLIDLPTGLTTAEYLAQGAQADAIFVDAMYPVPADLIEAMPNLKLIHSEGVGFHFIDTEAAKRRHVYVCNCRGCNAMAVAEQTILLMLGVLRDVTGGDAAVRQGNQITVKENYMVRGDLLELADCKVGLIGFGEIAKATARLLRTFGAQVYYNKPNRADAATEEAYGVQYLPQDELLATCDMVSLHAPVTEQTRNMANDAFFAKMKDGAFFFNTSRGDLVDSAALLRALESGKVRRAGLDTIAGEPVQTDNPLLTADAVLTQRILFSPHIGGITVSSFRRAYGMIWAAAAAVAAGQRPENVVNSWD
jgi:phosphoglycerate dehydrogenase-like enzyme